MNVPNAAKSETLPVVTAAELAADHKTGPAWLFEHLWLDEGVGILGGAPKCCKSWLALEIAVSLAAQRPCLQHYEPSRRGRVLIYMAEDAHRVVRERLEALCSHHGVALEALEIFAITADTLRLDLAGDQRRLETTVETLDPDLLILDPLVRLHRLDENHAGEISGLLAYLRKLQRAHHTAVLLVHHSRKNGSVSRPGQALRGSGDLHAFGDSNLYLRRVRDELVLTFEHRAAPAPEPVRIKLCGDPVHLKHVGGANPSKRNLDERVVSQLRNEPLARKPLRAALAVRNASLGKALRRLEAAGTIRKVDGRYIVCDSDSDP